MYLNLGEKMNKYITVPLWEHLKLAEMLKTGEDI